MKDSESIAERVAKIRQVERVANHELDLRFPEGGDKWYSFSQWSDGGGGVFGKFGDK